MSLSLLKNRLKFAAFCDEKHSRLMSELPRSVLKPCTLKNLVPETAPKFPPNGSTGTTPGIHVHKMESIKSTQIKQSTQTSEPVIPQIKWNTYSIELNGKTHKLPITKDHMLKEYSDIFEGVETLPRGPYCIRLKEWYKPMQPPLRSVPVAMQSAYRAELDRLVKEGITTEVKEHTQWINSKVPVMKSNGSLRLCLDPKDLNKVIERNQWYSRTIDGILPELAKSKYKTLKDATSGYWHVVLDLASSLLTMFNTPWGKFRWLRLPFGLKIASDVFQERLDRVLRLLKGIHGIADDILTHGETEIQHNRRLPTLLETARMNNLSLNPDKIQFNFTDCIFFGHRIIPQGLKPDPEKVKAIVDMKPPQSMQSLQSFNGMVNYLKRFSPVLTKLSECFRRLQKHDTIWAWESEHQTAFEKIKTILTTLPVLTYFDRQRTHYPDRCIKDWTQSSLTTRRSTSSLCIKSVDRHRVQAL